uniref:Uncharacterized protein n=1 Tax=Timema poppense TaxID=170557 RepID=A0A7R9D7S9_TIMPO|nr:unnamed protein product [Timema poppensis]
MKLLTGQRTGAPDSHEPPQLSTMPTKITKKWDNNVVCYSELVAERKENIHFVRASVECDVTLYILPARLNCEPAVLDDRGQMWYYYGQAVELGLYRMSVLTDHRGFIRLKTLEARDMKHYELWFDIL